MKTPFKIVGPILIAMSLLSGAVSLWQAYAAHSFSSGSLAAGRYGTFGRELAEHAAEVRTTRAVIFGGISFVFGASGIVLLFVGIKMKPRNAGAASMQAQAAAQQGYPQQGYPQQGYPQQGYAPQGYGPGGPGQPPGA